MSDETTTAGGKRRKRETWRDWLPEGAERPAVMPRWELLDRLEAEGLKVTERELRYWESAGALPAPVRMFLRGAVHAVYPPWYGAIVRKVAELRAAGIPYRDMRDTTREEFAHLALAPPAETPLPGIPEAPPIPEELSRALTDYMQQLNAGRDQKATLAEVYFVTSTGRVVRSIGVYNLA